MNQDNSRWLYGACLGTLVALATAIALLIPISFVNFAG